ncbi:hypothetical protein CWATWH0402_2644 [Crocosphaera watsonii WH 0402]|uniref:Uncharacterized protein n=1 Tax=Crocosphaera watsonii WH 0402 TaxID=1284629 RepID=T2JRV0_CROWT|nr:hypothetical protein CWATWH0402_2644 [Crocosphaera watsonii WH 0402]
MVNRGDRKILAQNTKNTKYKVNLINPEKAAALTGDKATATAETPQ